MFRKQGNIPTKRVMAGYFSAILSSPVVRAWTYADGRLWLRLSDGSALCVILVID